MSGVVWWVGFVDAADVAWWQRWLRPGYRHCWAAREIDANLWMLVEWTPERVVFGLANAPLMQRYAAQAHEVLVWVDPVNDPPTLRRPVLAIHQCASIVSHVMGIRPRPFATPWWLACAMRRLGASSLVRAASEVAP